MKKNAMLKIAAILLVAVLLTTCAISATFAKYVTSDEIETTTARVAKWGVGVEFSAEANIFKKAYETTNGVVVEATELVVAPGTQVEEALTITLSGKPEVALQIKPNFTFALSGWEIEVDGVTETYCPVEFIISDGTTDIPVKNVADIDATADAINDAVAALATEFNASGKDFVAPNTDIAKVITIGWKWDYEGNDNAKDTLLGDTWTSHTISFGGSISVEQYGANHAE